MRSQLLIASLGVSVLFAACARPAARGIAPSVEPVVALAAAIAVMPVSEVNQRVLVRDELRRDAGLDGTALEALERRLGDLRWFETLEQAKQYCDVRAGGCVQSSVKSIEKTGGDWRIVISQSMLGGCGFQHFVVKAYVTSGIGVVRSVTAGDSASCGRRG